MRSTRRGMIVRAGGLSVIVGLLALHPEVLANARRGRNEVDRAFYALQRGRWQSASNRFTRLVAQADAARDGPSSAPKEGSKSTENSRDLMTGLEDYLDSMGGRQMLLTFACFSAALSGDESCARKYFESVREMRGPMWGRSCDHFALQAHKQFFSALGGRKPKFYGRLLRYAGELLLDAGSHLGVLLLEKSWRLDPADPDVPAMLASFHLLHGSPGKARREAAASLGLKADSPCVLMDLATAEWVLGHCKAAQAASLRTLELDASMPGPHAMLAFLALQRREIRIALREARIARRLDHNEVFYRTVFAACLFAKGDEERAHKIVEIPDDRQLRAWFFRREPMRYARLSRAS